MNIITNIAKIYFKDLPSQLKFNIIACISIIFVSFLILRLTKIKSLDNCQQLSFAINDWYKIKTKKVIPVFWIISPYISWNKKQVQILPYYLFDKNNIFYILETFWWSEYTLWKNQKNKIAQQCILFLRYISNLLALSMFYVVIFWYFGVEEFQNLDFLFVLLFMFLWIIFLGILLTLYIERKISNYLEEDKILSKKDKRKLKIFAKFFWIWPFANVIFETIRSLLWVFNAYKFKKYWKK